MTALFAAILLTVLLIIAFLVPWRNKREPSIVDTFESLREQVGVRSIHIGFAQAIDSAANAFAQLDAENVTRRDAGLFDLTSVDPTSLISHISDVETRDVTSF